MILIVIDFIPIINELWNDWTELIYYYYTNYKMYLIRYSLCLLFWQMPLNADDQTADINTNMHYVRRQCKNLVLQDYTFQCRSNY